MKLLCILGPSGSGKRQVLKQYCSTEPNPMIRWVGTVYRNQSLMRIPYTWLPSKQVVLFGNYLPEGNCGLDEVKGYSCQKECLDAIRYQNETVKLTIFEGCSVLEKSWGWRRWRPMEFAFMNTPLQVCLQTNPNAQEVYEKLDKLKQKLRTYHTIEWRSGRIDHLVNYIKGQ